MLHFMEAHLLWVWVELFFVGVIALGLMAYYSEEISKKAGNVLGYGLVCACLLIFFGLGLWVWWTVLESNYKTIGPTHPVTVLKVSNLDTNSADVTYSLDGLLKDDTYSGVIKVSTQIKTPIMDAEVQENFYGDKQTVLTNLTIPNNYIK